MKSCTLIGLLGIAWVSAGCSNKPVVEGSVTLDGQPLETGLINFFPAEGTKGPSAGTDIVNGRYHIPTQKGVAAGMNRVEIRSIRLVNNKMRETIPIEYNSKTTLVKTINPGLNTLDFELKSKSLINF